MWFTILMGIAALLLFLILGSILYLRRNYGVLDKSGYPVVKPMFVFGSGPFKMHKTNCIEIDTKRHQQYGSVYGAYWITQPWVYVSDPEMIKQICIKDFDHFPAHQLVFQEKKYKSLDSTEGAEWKELRKAMSPVFTSGKLKGMISLMDGALDNMINYLNKEVKVNPEIYAKFLFSRLALDIIGLTAFAININCFEKENETNPIYLAAKEAIAEFRIKTMFESVMFQGLLGLSGIFGDLDFVTDGIRKLWDHVKRIQDEREANGNKYGDFVDRLIEMKSSLVKSGLISEEQVTAQGMIFFLAGYDTTSRGMTALLYFLSKNQEEYDILQDEIDSVDGDNFNHDTIADLPYLEACLKESMRLLPAIARNDRKCVKDWEYKGYKIKKGTCVGLMNYVVHHHPDYWPEPELFKPERFLKENAGNIIPCTYLPFGAGPRACIGERFAMVEMKIAMAKLLQNFRIEATDETKLNFKKGDHFGGSHDDLKFKFIPRK